MRSGAFAPDCPFVIFVVACGDCLQIPSGASRLPTADRARPRGYVRLGLSRCWTCGWGRECSGLPILAARAAKMGVCVFEGLAGVLRGVASPFL